MKRLLICLLFLPTFSLRSSCLVPAAGTRCWDIAATALDLIITTQVILDELIENIAVDISGVYTVAASIDDGLSSANMSLYTINSSLDELALDIGETQSKLTLLTSQLGAVATFIDEINADISGTYTALDALESTIVSELDILAIELENVQIVIGNITSSSIDHTESITSQLDILQLDVNELNSLLDSINWLNLNSSVDRLSSLIDLLSSNVTMIQNTITIGFIGTFTVLDDQLREVDIIESMAEHVHVTDMTDFSGVFTALAQLDSTTNAIESLVDIITLIKAKDTVIATESLMDLSLSYLDMVESKIIKGPSVVDHAISVLDTVQLPLLDQSISKLAVTIQELDTIESSVDTISSKLSEIIDEELYNVSLLELINDNSMATISILDNVAIPISKLDAVDSRLDTFIGQEFTIESLVDDILIGLTTINSALDPLITQAEQINSILATVEIMDFTISSELDITIDNLFTINSTLDQITNTSQSSLALLATIESRLDQMDSLFDSLSFVSIESKLAITSGLENSVISKLDVIIPFIATLNNEAQGLINDFQSTWTILNKINSSLTTSQTTLNIIESTLEHLNPRDISTVFTVINTIVRNEATINSQVDVYNSMVDAFNRLLTVDFNGVFTALTVVNASEIASSSMLSTISSKLSNIQTEFGFPIYGSMLGGSGYVIAAPGRYYLAENITFLPAISGSSAIYISVNDVALDFNEKILSQNQASGLLANGVYNFNTRNTRIFNGSVANFQGYGLSSTSCTNVLMYDINAFNNGLTTGSNINFGTDTIRNIVVTNCLASNPSVFTGFKFQGPQDLSANNVLIRGCQAINTGATNYSGGLGLLFTNNVVIENSIAGFNPTVGIRCGIGQNIVVDSCICFNNGFVLANRRSSGIEIETNIPGGPNDRGIGAVVKNCIVQGNNNGIAFFASATSLQDSVIINNYVINNVVAGIDVMAGPTLTLNNAILFNTCIQNGSNIDELSNPGANTYLGNFAFNTTAVGNPNNTNYAMTSSNITSKFVTGSQRGSFGDFPDKWHNINMLP